MCTSTISAHVHGDKIYTLAFGRKGGLITLLISGLSYESDKKEITIRFYYYLVLINC